MMFGLEILKLRKCRNNKSFEGCLPSKGLINSFTMHFIGIVISLLLVSFVISAQENNATNQFEASVGFLHNVALGTGCDGAGALDDGSGVNLGILYSHKTGKSKWFVAGINLLQTNHLYHGAVVDPRLTVINNEQIFTIYQIPFGFRFEFPKSFYFKPLATINIHSEGDNWYGSHNSGLGFIMGAGKFFDVSDNVSISVEAYTGYLPVIAYPLERKSCRNHFIPMGLSLNFGYRL